MKILSLVLIDVLILTAFIVFVAIKVGSGSFVAGFPVAKEAINGIIVPLASDSIEGAVSIGGIDTDDDILQDSVERMLVEEFGDNPEFYKRIKEYAVMTQIVILNPTPDNIAKYSNFLACMRDVRMFDAAVIVDNFTIDTEERKDVYYEVLKVIIMSAADEDC